jgi:hypothetical protein
MPHFCMHPTRNADTELRFRPFKCDGSWYDEYWYAEISQTDRSLIAARIGSALGLLRRGFIEAEGALRRRLCACGRYLVSIVLEQHGRRTWRTRVFGESA